MPWTHHIEWRKPSFDARQFNCRCSSLAAHLSQLDDFAVVQVFNKIINSEIVPLYSGKIIEEYKAVLSRKNFSFDTSIINYTLALIMKKGIEVDPKPSGIHMIDMEDLVFYEVVLEKKEDGAYLITGNKKHFPNNPIVVTAAEFLDIINTNNSGKGS